MKLVLDTNVLVSALLRPEGPSGRILRRILSGAFELGVDERIFAEYSEVLARPKFRFDPTEVTSLLATLRARAQWVETRPLAIGLVDPKDEPFLEVAIAGGAKLLVTGNARHFPAALAGVLVVSPRQLVETLGPD